MGIIDPFLLLALLSVLAIVSVIVAGRDGTGVGGRGGPLFLQLSRLLSLPTHAFVIRDDDDDHDDDDDSTAAEVERLLVTAWLVVRVISRLGAALPPPPLLVPPFDTRQCIEHQCTQNRTRLMHPTRQA